MFQNQEWIFSKEVETNANKNLSPGIHTLYIEDQSFDPDSQKYTLYLHAIDSDEKGRISWFLQKKDGDKNQYAVNTLITLGTALQGKPIGVPFQDCVKYGLVTAEVVMSPPRFSEVQGKDVSYPNIYRFGSIDAQTYLELKGLGFRLISQSVIGQDGQEVDSDTLEG